MLDHTILLPSKPRAVKEEGNSGVFEIDGFYPGYGHTIGNSLRRVILSSLPGAAITSIKIDGVKHEFSTLDGMQEDVVTVLLNLKKVRFRIDTDEPQEVSLKVKGAKKIHAGDIQVPGQVEVLNPDQYICETTDKNAEISATMKVEKGLGYVPKEVLQKEKLEVGTIVTDAVFTPVRRVNYEVKNMRVGERTDHNRLRITIETDGTLTPRSALENSIAIMIEQLQAIVGFQPMVKREETHEVAEEAEEGEKPSTDMDTMKTRIEDLTVGARTVNALASANIRTVGGLARKKEDDLLDIDGLGSKGVSEIKKALADLGISLKQ